MRNILIPMAAAATSLAFAAPASAQWHPQPRPSYGYSQGYGYHQGYGYNRGFNLGHARNLQIRIDRIQSEIRQLARYRMISPVEYRRLRNQSRQVERNLRRQMRDGYGLTPREAYMIERQIARLEYRMARDMRDGRRYAYGRRF